MALTCNGPPTGQRKRGLLQPFLRHPQSSRREVVGTVCCGAAPRTGEAAVARLTDQVALGAGEQVDPRAEQEARRALGQVDGFHGGQQVGTKWIQLFKPGLFLKI